MNLKNTLAWIFSSDGRERDGCQRKESDTILDLDIIACDLYVVSPS